MTLTSAARWSADHGCGVKSYLYGLETVGVGAPGGVAGDCQDGLSLIYELRIDSQIH